MDLLDIYQLCNYISNKEKSGNAFTPNQFNGIIDILNRDFFKKKVEESGYFDEGLKSYNYPLTGSKNLHRFIHNETIAPAAATTYTFAYPLGATITATGVQVEFISEQEYNDRVGDSVIAPSATAPVALERGNNIYTEPNVNIDLSYYFYPDTPQLDYYIDINGIIQYLDEGDTHVWATGEIDSSGDAHTIGDPDWASLTVELGYNSDMHNDFMNEILSRVGVRLGKQGVTQMAETWKQEQKQM